MLIHLCTARRRQSSQSLRKLCLRVRVRSVICAEARGQSGHHCAPASGAYRPWEPAPSMLSMFSSATCLTCKSPSQTLSGRHQSSTPAGAAQRCRHRQRAISGLLRAIRDCRPCACAASFLPVPGLQAAMPDPGPLHCTAITRCRAANSHASRPSACRPANVATSAACSVLQLEAAEVKATRHEKAW